MKTNVSIQDNNAVIKALLQDPIANLIEIKNLVRNDTKLRSLVLKVINNPFFGLEEKIDDSDRAIDLLGVVQLNELLSEEVIQSVQENSVKPAQLTPIRSVVTEQTLLMIG